MTISKSILVIIAVVCFALILSSCTANGVVEGHLNEEFSLHIGQTAYIADENLKIEFVEVIGDSRCPRGVTCVWAGEVSCMMEITYMESLHRLLLTQPGLTNEPSTETFKKFQITFHVEPYPEAGKDIPEIEYRLLLMVRK